MWGSIIMSEIVFPVIMPEETLAMLIIRDAQREGHKESVQMKA